jgi:hypothetical protein
MAKIAQGLHVSTDYLLGLKEQKEGKQQGETTATKTQDYDTVLVVYTQAV